MVGIRKDEDIVQTIEKFIGKERKVTLRGTFEDLTGKVFGRLTVIERTDDYVYPSGRRRPAWRCICERGGETVALASNLKRGTTTSCGCFQKENMSKLKKTHGGYANNEPLYMVWLDIRKRCLSPKSRKYADYGGRGIAICEQWADSYVAFREWSLNNGYHKGLSIDRIDVNGSYSPENCRWTNSLTQQNNRRCNINVTYQNQTHTLKEWSRIRGINYQTLYTRHKLGWDTPRLLGYID